MALGAKTLAHGSAKELEVLRTALEKVLQRCEELGNEDQEVARQLLNDVEEAQKTRAKMERARS